MILPEFIRRSRIAQPVSRPAAHGLASATAIAATVFLLLNTGAVSAPAPIECRWTDTPPVLDGRADESAWKSAQVVSGFVQGWLPGCPAAKAGTKARLLWDREWLYFFAEMEDEDIVATGREHDGPLWNADVFELFFRPSNEHAGYYEFEVNPAEAVLDAFFPDRESWHNPNHLKGDNFHVEAKVALRGTMRVVDDSSSVATDHDHGWSVEGRIPWTDFLATGGRPVPGEKWRVNMARVNGVGPTAELSSTAALSKRSFHQIDEYTELQFIGPEQIRRAEWHNSHLIGTPEGPAEYSISPAWPGLKANALVTATPSPDGQWMWIIEQQPGWDQPMTLRRFRTSGDGSEAETLLALDDFAYSIAFHPRFAENGHVFLGVNGPWRKSPSPRTSRVLRYTVRDGRPDSASKTVIIEWPSAGHNGGALAFGADGNLFLTSGDGTTDSDLDHAGQDTRSLRSKVLRIDVDQPADGRLYSVPRDNPFVDDERFAPETWAYGLRNPWRLTYDAASDQLWAGENGQDQWEYARLIQRGANYGWSVYEGSHPFALDRKQGPHPVTFPTLEFSHAEFRSLSGGVVYRGNAFPELVGAYVFGDFGTGRIWAAKHNGQRLEWTRELLDSPLSITHVTTDAAGELIVTAYGVGASGGIHRLARAAKVEQPTPAFPRTLKETGLFSDTAKLSPSPGVLRYDINLPAWHDGASSDHHLAIPGGEAIEVRPVKCWQAPDGTALAQTLVLEGQRIETRVLLKQQNDWAAYTYRWNDEQTDAALVEKAGATLQLKNGRAWRIPSRAECMMCHSRQANFALTLHEAQLNVADQLTRWERLGLFSTDAATFERDRAALEKHSSLAEQANDQRTSKLSPLLPRNPEHLRRFAKADDQNSSLEMRARSYLGANCAHCHTLYGGGNSMMDFDWLLPRQEMHALDERPQHGDFQVPEARVIAQGAAARSIIVPRVSIRGNGQMPPVGTISADPDGPRLLVEWIDSLRK